MTRTKKEDKILSVLRASKKARRSALARLPLKVKIRQLIEMQKIDWATKPEGRKPRFRPWLSP